MSEPVFQAIRCPQCAAPLAAGEGRRVITCGHCGVRILVREHGGYTRWVFPADIGRLEAVGVGSGWLKTTPDLDAKVRSAVIVEASLLYAPIWEYTALVAGWEFGTRLKTETVLVGEEKSERLDLRLVRENIEEPRLNERRFYQAALDLSAIGVTRPRITGREFALPLLAGATESEASLLEAAGTAADITEAGRRSALMPLSGDTGSGTRLFALRERVNLLYYPLWLLRYRVGDRLYEMTVDGRDGTIFSARAPASNSRRLVATVAQIGALAVVLAVIVGVLPEWGLGRVPTIVIAVIVSVMMVVAARQFRLRGEVEYHEPYSS